MEYKPLDPAALRLPAPQPPSERLLAAVEAFYSPPSHERPRNRWAGDECLGNQSTGFGLPIILPLFRLHGDWKCSRKYKKIIEQIHCVRKRLVFPYGTRFFFCWNIFGSCSYGDSFTLICHFQKCYNTLCLSFQILHRHSFLVLLGLKWSQGKIEQCLYKILEDKERVLRYFWKWSIGTTDHFHNWWRICYSILFMFIRPTDFTSV